MAISDNPTLKVVETYKLITGLMPDSKDVSSPELIKDIGSYHPINQMKDSLMNLLLSFGFEIVDGPEIETEEFNFDMLNIKISSCKTDA